MAKKKRRAHEVFGSGLFQGATLNYGDEILRALGGEEAARALVEDERASPLAFGAGNVLGSVLVPTAMGGAFVRGAKGVDFLRRAAISDGAAGAVSMSGGYDPAAQETGAERARNAAIGGATGATVAGLMPAAFSAGNQARLNAPVLRGKPALHADQDLVPANSWTPQRMVDEALARDEAKRRAAGDAMVFGAYGREARPIDADGPNVRSLFDVAMRDGTAAGLFGQATDESFRQGLREQIKQLRTSTGKGVPKPRADAPTGVSRRKTVNAEVEALRADLLAAIDDNMAHREWTKLAYEMWGADKDAAHKFAGRLLAIMEARVERAAGEDLVQLAQRLQPGGDIAQKLKALGVDEGGGGEALRRAGRARERGQAASKEVARPFGDRRTTFTSADDNIAARSPRQREGRSAPRVPDDAPGIGMRDWEATATMGELLRPRRMNYVPPSASADPLFEMKARLGAKWENPFVAADPGVAQAGFYAGKFVPPVADQLVTGHGLSYLPDVVRDMLEDRRAKSSAVGRPPNRWIPA